MKKIMFRPVSDFFHAIDNEWAIDKEVDLRLYGNEISTVFRPLKTRKYISQTRFSAFFYPVFLWGLFFLIPVYFIFSLLKITFFILFRESKSASGLQRKNVVLDFNNRTAGLVDKVKGGGLEYVVINNVLSDKKSSILNYIDFIDCIQAFFLSIVSFFLSIFKRSPISCRFNVIFSFYWFLTYLSMKRITPEKFKFAFPTKKF